MGISFPPYSESVTEFYPSKLATKTNKSRHSSKAETLHNTAQAPVQVWKYLLIVAFTKYRKIIVPGILNDVCAVLYFRVLFAEFSILLLQKK